MRELRDLLAATEAVGDEDGSRSGGFDGGEQILVGDGFRDFELIRLKAEGAGHAATAGLDGLDRGAGLAQEGDFTGRAAEDSFVMAVAVDENVRASEAAGTNLRGNGAWRPASRPGARPAG